MDTEPVTELPPNMVARRKADTSALQGVIRNSLHNQALQATSPTNKWSPRAGRNAHYVQFEEYLRRVARIMGIKYDGIGNTPAPVATSRPGVATRNSQQDQASDDEALAQWQIESTRLYDFAVAAVCFDGLYQETDLNMMHSYSARTSQATPRLANINYVWVIV